MSGNIEEGANVVASEQALKPQKQPAELQDLEALNHIFTDFKQKLQTQVDGGKTYAKVCQRLGKVVDDLFQPVVQELETIKNGKKEQKAQSTNSKGRRLSFAATGIGSPRSLRRKSSVASSDSCDSQLAWKILGKELTQRSNRPPAAHVRQGSTDSNMSIAAEDDSRSVSSELLLTGDDNSTHSRAGGYASSSRRSTLDGSQEYAPEEFAQGEGRGAEFYQYLGAITEAKEFSTPRPQELAFFQFSQEETSLASQRNRQRQASQIEKEQESGKMLMQMSALEQSLKTDASAFRKFAEIIQTTMNEVEGVEKGIALSEDQLAIAKELEQALELFHTSLVQAAEKSEEKRRKEGGEAGDWITLHRPVTPPTASLDSLRKFSLPQHRGGVEQASLLSRTLQRSQTFLSEILPANVLAPPLPSHQAALKSQGNAAEQPFKESFLKAIKQFLKMKMLGFVNNLRDYAKKIRASKLIEISAYLGLIGSLGLLNFIGISAVAGIVVLALSMTFLFILYRIDKHLAESPSYLKEAEKHLEQAGVTSERDWVFSSALIAPFKIEGSMEPISDISPEFSRQPASLLHI